ncbi:MAG: EcsC family protein, partial [Candidatus Competibacteraceae bacterium]|nr:EcsC family protein [Candidatus Competibacteraceae bacterium]
MTFDAVDREELRQAMMILENPSFAARLSHAVGSPLEKTLALLPAPVSSSIHSASRQAITKALDVAVVTLNDGYPAFISSTRTHQVLSGLSGAVSGFFGAPALVMELPVSTVIMLRSIAAIAQQSGEDIQALEARLACLEVFALGGRSAADDGADTGYYAIRATLAHSMAEAIQYIAGRGVIDESAPALVRLIAQIGSRFGVTVSQKLTAQALPVLGALGGASINLMFLQHFQRMAKSHFSVRGLERRYGRVL